MNIDIDPRNIVLQLNKLLALEPQLVLELMQNRPSIKQDATRELLGINGNKASMMGIINAILKDHDSKYIIGADCEFEDGTMIYVKFFHLLERE